MFPGHLNFLELEALELSSTPRYNDTITVTALANVASWTLHSLKRFTMHWRCFSCSYLLQVPEVIQVLSKHGALLEELQMLDLFGATVEMMSRPAAVTFPAPVDLAHLCPNLCHLVVDSRI